MDYEYYDRKLRRAEGIYKICYWCLVAIFIFIVILLLTACKSYKSNVKEKTTEQDSVRIEYREKIVKVPVTVYVEVPAEQKEKITRDSTSHLETSFAVSDASMIWIDGVAFLRHSLANKPQKIAKQDSVPVVEKETIQWKTRRVTYNKTEIREKQLTWWQKGLMYMGALSLILLMIYLCLLVLKIKLRR